MAEPAARGFSHRCANPRCIQGRVLVSGSLREGRWQDCPQCALEREFAAAEEFGRALGADVVIPLGPPGALPITGVLALGEWWRRERLGQGSEPDA